MCDRNKASHVFLQLFLSSFATTLLQLHNNTFLCALNYSHGSHRPRCPRAILQERWFRTASKISWCSTICKIHGESQASPLFVVVTDPAMYSHTKRWCLIFLHLLCREKPEDITEEGHNRSVRLHLAHVACDQHVLACLLKGCKLKVPAHKRFLCCQPSLPLLRKDPQHTAFDFGAHLKSAGDCSQRHIGELPKVHERCDELTEAHKDSILRHSHYLTDNELGRGELRHGDECVLLEVVLTSCHYQCSIKEIVRQHSASGLRSRAQSSWSFGCIRVSHVAGRTETKQRQFFILPHAA
mmetsp:Transcript_142261/g.273324  ORF Transcript_142261/g.273324 Transcript_142261/m.273324 type:complete len:297 (+) Transcript_142261:194-1084(+)